jgi:hypothetical protein
MNARGEYMPDRRDEALGRYLGEACRSAEEGPLWGSDRGDTHEAGGDTLRAGSTVASPQAGPLLHAAPARNDAGAAPDTTR